MRFRTQLAWMLMLVSILAVVQANAAQISDRRFYANTILSWWPNSKDVALFRKFVDESKQKGMNSISIDIPWSIENPGGNYDFNDFDTRLEYIVSKRLSTFVRLNMSTAGNQKPYWLKDDMLMTTADGKVFSLPDGTTFASLAHPVVVAKMESFSRAVAKHLFERCRPFPSGEYPVVALIPAFNHRMTMDYPTGSKVDYSAAAAAEFNKWTRKTYGSVIKLNAAWKTGYKSWNDVSLAKAPAPIKEFFFSYTIKRAFDSSALAVRKANQYVDVALQTEAAWEDPSYRSLPLSYIGERADWLIVSDPPNANHSFSVDVLRSASMGRSVATEIDAPIHINATNARYFNQGVRSFEHGAKAIIASNWDLANVRNNDGWPFLHEMGRLTRVRASYPRPTTAIYLSTWDLINGIVKLSDYQAVYDQITGNGKVPVDVLTDDVIARYPGRLTFYKEIYLPANWTIPNNIRGYLKPYSSKLKVSQPLAAGTLDEFGVHRDPLMGTVANSK